MQGQRKMEVTQQKCTVYAYKQYNIVDLPHASFATLIGYLHPLSLVFSYYVYFVCVFACGREYEYIMVQACRQEERLQESFSSFYYVGA